MTRAHAENPNGSVPGRDAASPGRSTVRPAGHRTSAEQLARAAHGTRSAAIRWKIGAVAGKRAFGVVADRIALEMRIDETAGGHWSGVVRVAGDDGEPTTLSEREIEVRWQADPELQLLHIDADGFVRATIDTSNGVPRLLYARSGVLGELGLDGGRYEPESTEYRLAE